MRKDHMRTIREDGHTRATHEGILAETAPALDTALLSQPLLLFCLCDALRLLLVHPLLHPLHLAVQFVIMLLHTLALAFVP